MRSSCWRPAAGFTGSPPPHLVTESLTTSVLVPLQVQPAPPPPPFSCSRGSSLATFISCVAMELQSEAERQESERMRAEGPLCALCDDAAAEMLEMPAADIRKHAVGHQTRREQRVDVETTSEGPDLLFNFTLKLQEKYAAAFW
ncbi:hypothetical protein ILYODFUR_023068 [Ilyodon furcidens]|uniref:Uncharacterized protein n=1 Tax=Ilyodon furcidens TaxID=33524 RepID=A0ABV0SZD9_9TELE